MVPVSQALSVAPRSPEPTTLPIQPYVKETAPMNASRIARTVLLAALASAVAVGCSKKVKEEPVTSGPVDGRD